MIIGFDGSRAFVDQRTGTENYSYNLLKALAKIDKENQYVVYIRKITNFQLPRFDREARRAITNQIPNSNFQFKKIPLTRLWTQVGLAYRTWMDKLDVLFVPAHTLPVLRKPGLKTVVTIHDLGYEYLPQYHQFPQKYYLNWSTKYAVKTATKIIAVSKATSNDLITKLQCDIQKINVIYEGVESGKFQKRYTSLQIDTVLKKYGISGSFVLSVGTIQPRKNYQRLIEAFFKLELGIKNYELRSPVIPDKLSEAKFDPESIKINKYCNNLQLIIVGKRGWMWEEIVNLPKKLGIREKVKFLEYVTDSELAILYQKARCMALPSLFEGFGLPILEAMASGCPVVAGNSSSLPEVVGEAGILVDPYDINSIAEGLSKMIFDRGTLRDDLRKKGLQRIKEFSWEKTAERTLKVFEKIVS